MVSAGTHDVDARNCSECAVHSDEVAERAKEVDTVAGAKNALSLTEPGQVPCDSNRRGDIIQVVALQVGQDIRVGRVLSDELHLGQVGARAGESRRSRTGRARRIRQCGLIIADDSRIQTVFFDRLPVVFPVHTEVQCEIGTELPVVLEIDAHLTLDLPEEFSVDDRRAG
jgi:hypothetical protein